MKKDSNEISLKEAINRLIKAYGIENKLDEVSINKSWEELMGPTIAKRTEKIYLHKKTLVLKLSSSVLKNELYFAQDKIIEKLNKKIGKTVVAEIRFI